MKFDFASNDAFFIVCFDLCDVLSARQFLFAHQALLRQSPITLIGPQECELLFADWDAGNLFVALWPKGEFEHLSWLTKRTVKKWFTDQLANLEGQVLCVSRQQWPTHLEWLAVLVSDLQQLPLNVLSDLPASPKLQAGPKSLAAATHYYRNLDASLHKRLCVLDGQADFTELEVHALLDTAAQTPAYGKPDIKRKILLIVVLFNAKNQLQVRQLKAGCLYVVQSGLTQLIGHLAYADDILTNSPCITRLGVEMGKFLLSDDVS